MPTHQDIAEQQLRNEPMSVETWLLRIYVNELHLSELTGKLLIGAKADRVAVAKAISGGATEQQVVEIFT